MTPEEVSKVDVLIIGAGPAGLMLATWLARLGVKTRIVDKRFDRINSGQADGLQSRTFEIFDSLGFGQDVWRQANHMLEIRFWNPDQEGQLYRSDAIIDTKAGLSRFQQATLHQGCIEDYIFKYIQKHSDITVERALMPESLTIDAAQAESDDAYPVSITLRELPKPADEAPAANGNGNKIPNGLYRSNLAADPNAALLQSAQATSGTRTEKILAKYVVGCDGAHSWTRRQIGSVMEGEQTDYVWGVLDIVPVTDFREC
ncbi:FAD-binding monooxygenase [Staphylotrichum tortipilum]|uniref:FAD-binding monooxygenase n=1 Tax=Staphylotrichum tortipilum TaxID=2831512 RepID=A0AAN6MAF1_9PEZI|nr:FAD-binding monooxygenase [Staphylotrichum longicolle]